MFATIKVLRNCFIKPKFFKRQVVSVSKNPSLFDEKIELTISGLKPSKVITVYATTQVTETCHYESFAQYKSSNDGVVNLSKDPAVNGTYTGVDQMGLFWSMQAFAPNKKQLVRFAKPGFPEPRIYNFQVFDKDVNDISILRMLNITEKPIFSKQVERLFMAPGVKRIEVNDHGFSGVLFLPKSDGPFPGLINLFGGFPGVVEFKSALQANHGFASLALGYIDVPGQPKNLVDCFDLAYFEKAVDFLMNHPKIKNEIGVGIVSICKGAQIATAMASILKNIRCVVWINGSVVPAIGDLKYKNCIWQQIPLLPTANTDKDESKPYVLKDYFATDINQQKKKIFPFHKRLETSYLFLSSEGDNVLPSALQADLAKEMLQKSGHTKFEIIKYANAGHLLEPVYSPFINPYFQPGKPFHVYMDVGGEMIPHHIAQQDSWQRQLNFLAQEMV